MDQNATPIKQKARACCIEISYKLYLFDVLPSHTKYSDIRNSVDWFKKYDSK